MSRYRRWNELLELLAADGQLQVERAAQVLGVSAATVRRDFDELARQQMLTRIRGGAVAKGVTYDLPLRYKTERHPTEKQRIAAVAAGLVLPGQIAGLNGGTTTTEVARALAVRADLNSGAPSLAVTTTWAARAAMSRLVLASPSWCAVAPATASIPSTPRNAMSRVTCSRTPVASGPVSS